MKLILKRSLSLIMAIAMMASFVLTGAPAAFADGVLTVKLECTEATPAEGETPGSYAYSITAENNTGVITGVTAAGMTVPDDLTAPVVITGTEPATEVKVAVDGLTFTFSGGLLPTAVSEQRQLAASVSLSNGSVTILKGKTAELTASGPSNISGYEIVWSSDNEAAATVSDGVVTAVATGTANVKATLKLSGGDTIFAAASCAVSVDEPAVSSVKVIPKNGTDVISKANLGSGKIAATVEVEGKYLSEVDISIETSDDDLIVSTPEKTGETKYVYTVKYSGESNGDKTFSVKASAGGVYQNAYFKIDNIDPTPSYKLVVAGDAATAQVEVSGLNEGETITYTDSGNPSNTGSSVAPAGGSLTFTAAVTDGNSLTLVAEDPAGNSVTEEAPIGKISLSDDEDLTGVPSDGSTYYFKADNEDSFRLPIVSSVSVDLSGRSIGGYTIQKDGTGYYIDFTGSESVSPITAGGNVTVGISLIPIAGGTSNTYVLDKAEPTVTATVSGEGVVVGDDGKLFIPTTKTVVGGVETVTAPVVTITATAADDNLTGWTDTETKEITFAAQSGKLDDFDTSAQTLTASASDKAGNVSGQIKVQAENEETFAATSVTFTPSYAKPPVVSITPTTPNDKGYYTEDFNIPVSITDGDYAIASVSVKFNGEIVSTSAGDISIPVTVTDLETEALLEITVTDAKNNTTNYTKSYLLDGKAPVISDPGVTDGSFYNEGQTVSFTITDANLDLTNSTISLNGSEPTGVSSEAGKITANFTVDPGTNAEASYTLEVSAVDAAGLSNTLSAAFTVDKKAPTVALGYDVAVHGEDNNYYSESRELTVTVAEGYLDSAALTVKLTAPDGTETSTDETLTVGSNPFTFSTEGHYVLTLSATDKAGNETTEALGNITLSGKDPLDFYIDKSDPKVELSLNGTAANGSYFKADRTATVTVTEPFFDSGTLTVGFTAPDGTTTTTSHALAAGENSITFDSDGHYILTLSVKDKAGHETTTTEGNFTLAGDAPLDFYIDKTAPVISLTTTVTDGSGQELDSYLSTAPSGLVYVKLAEPVTDDNKDSEPQTIAVTFTLTVTDNNISTGSVTGGDWIGTPVPNTESTLSLTKTLTVAKNASGVYSFNISVLDLAGNVADAFTSTLNSSVITIDPTALGTGTFEKSIVIDRRQPTSGNDTDAPAISITNDAAVIATLTGDVPLYASAPTFTATIKDDKALGEIKWSVSGGPDGFASGSGSITDFTADFKNYDLSMPVTISGENESNELVLTVTAKDEAGNSITYTKTFAVDTQAPRVTVEFDPNDVKNEKYFKDARTATVTVTDLNFDAAAFGDTNGTTDGTWTASGENHTLTYTFDPGADAVKEYVFTVASVSDLAGHTVDNSDVTYSGTAPYAAFVVDKQAPTAVLTVKAASGTVSAVKNSDAIFYANEAIVLTLSAEDYYIDTAASSLEWASTSTAIVNKTDEDSNNNAVKMTSEITLSDAAASADRAGEELKGMSVKLFDMAGNPVKAVTIVYDASFTPSEVLTAFSGSDGAFANADHLVIDNKAPVVEFTLPNTPNNTAKPAGSAVDVDYYSPASGESVTATITLKDINLDLDETNITINISGEDTTIQGTWNELAALGNSALSLNDAAPTYTLTYTIEDGVRFDGFEVSAKDKANNTNNDQTVANPIIVDTTAPVISLAVSVTSAPDENGQVQELDGYLCKTAEGESGNIYLLLKEPVTDDNKGTEPKKIEVTFVLAVADKNITIGENGTVTGVILKLNGDQSTEAWVGDTLVNADSTVKLTRTLTVEKNKSDEYRFDISVLDLAGNAAEDFNAVLPDKDGNETTVEVKHVGDDKGKFAETIIIDRRQPTSGGDDSAPEIVVSVNPNSEYRTEGNVQLFAEAPTFSMTIKDDYALSKVTWSISGGPEGFVTGSDTITSFSDENRKLYSIDITPTVNGANEANDLKLTITAIDEAGNTITLVKPFAVDTKAPVITVDFDNNNVVNGKYYRDARTATITVTDINFVPENTFIVTNQGAQPQGGGWTYANGQYVSTAAWTNSGDTWTAKVYYGDSNGQDYNLDVISTDRAQNKGTSSEQNGAIPAFVVDLKDPIITVTYDNNAVQNGHYYNAGRVARVQIVETNFGTAQGVRYEGTASLDGASIRIPQLAGWTGTGDNHFATISFTEDGDYSFTINYTDLSGRTIARTFNSGLFTIDETAPTVEISNIEDYSANRGTVAPIISFEDINFDSSGYSVGITKIVNLTTKAEVDLGHTVTDTQHGVMLNYVDLDNILENDGIYTIYATITDLAGNTSSATITYSVNRKGSTYYAYDDATIGLLAGVYSKLAPTLRIAEVNPDDLTEYSVTVSVGSQNITLAEGVDYTVEQTGGRDSFKQYIYTIKSENFVDADDNVIEGSYVIVLDSKDTAGNSNSNRDNEMNSPVNFVLDVTPPIISHVGIEDRERVQAESRDVTIIFQDNSVVSRVEITLNGELIKVIEGEELEELGDEYSFTIDQSNQNQSLEVHVFDAAGNEAVMDPISFYINSSAFRQFLHNTPLLVGSIVGVAAIGGGVAFGVGRKKKTKTTA